VKDKTLEREPAAPQQAGDSGAAEFAAAVRAGLSKPGQKELPSQYFYDDVGSALFEAISLLPEYGLTRAGERLLREHAAEIVDRLDWPVIVGELGSGSGRKTRWILEELCRRRPTDYYPIEISPLALSRCQQELASIDSLSLVGLEQPYLAGLRSLAERRKDGEHILLLFLGSSIGNFDRAAGEEFLREVRGILAPGDALLLAADLVKDAARLLAAYDDPAGITAAFNLNLLARINRELEADFNLKQFEHLAVYNPGERRVEMHVRSRAEQTVRIRAAGIEVSLRRGETLHTENSHKYSVEEVAEMAARAGFRCTAEWVDAEWPFVQSLFIAR
jgi:L-histidine Nalpha-methyltransferase